jgi:hypothetical protein
MGAWQGKNKPALFGCSALGVTLAPTVEAGRKSNAMQSPGRAHARNDVQSKRECLPGSKPPV